MYSTDINTNVYLYDCVCVCVKQKTVNLYVISVTTKRIINFPTKFSLKHGVCRVLYFSF